MPTAAGIYYYTYGEDLAASTPMILLHGAGGDCRQWPYQMRRMPKHRVIAPDLPGHGRSSAMGRESVADYANWLAEWMDELKVAEAILVGHSMGAAICLSFALAHPEQVKGLVLIGGGAKYPVNATLLETLLIPVKVQTAVNKIVQWSFARESEESLHRTLRRQLMGNPEGQLYRDLVACSRVDLSQTLGSIKTSALILCGSEDRMMPPEHSRALQQGLHHSRFLEVRGGGHMVMQEKTGEVVGEIERYLETL